MFNNVPHNFSGPINFKVTDSGDSYYGNQLLSIPRICGILPDIDKGLEECLSSRNDIDEFTHHLQLLLSVCLDLMPLLQRT